MISLSFLCAVVTKRFIYFSYPGKLPAFREKYHSSLLEDEWLVGISAENGCELRLITDELEKNKLFLGIHVATGGQRYGPIETAQGVSFEKKTLADGGTEWVAEIASDDHKTLKRGRAIPRKMRPGETCFGGGSGILIPFRLPPAPPADDGMLPMALKLEEQLLQMVTQDMKRLGITPSDEPPEGQDKAPVQPVEGTQEPMLGAMNALEEALEEAYRQNMKRLGLEPYEEPPEGQDKPPSHPVEGTDPMLPAMDGLEDSIRSLVIQSMERRGITPSDDPPEGQENGSHERQ